MTYGGLLLRLLRTLELLRRFDNKRCCPPNWSFRLKSGFERALFIGKECSKRHLGPSFN